MLTRQKIKLQQGTSTEQASGQVTTKQYQRRKTAATKSRRKQRYYQPYHRSVEKQKITFNNLTKNNKEENPKSQQSQHTQRILDKEKQVKSKDLGDDLSYLKTIDTTVVSDADHGTWGWRLAVVNDKMAWIGTCYAGTIALFNTRGRVIQKLKMDLKPADISVNSNNDLIFSDFKGRYIYTFTNKKQQIIADLYPYQTRGLCWTSDNEILVCLYKTITVNKVVRVSLDGKILQTIQKDKNHKYIFSDPELIAENVNKDICVVDGYHNLIVVDRYGDVKFKFLQTSDDASRIFIGFYGIACDSLGCILLSDPDSNCIHMISGAGQYLQKVLTESFGLEKPWGLGTDNKNQLWISGNRDGKVKIIKYRS